MRHTQDSTRQHFPRPIRPGRRAAAPSCEELRSLFVERAIPVPQIAREWGTSEKVIYARIQEYGLRPDWDDVELRRLYIDERRSVAEIAEALDKSPSRIYQMLDRFGIPRREYGKPKPVRPARPNPPDEATLRRLYEVERHPMATITALTGWSATTIKRHVARLGIPRRGHGPIQAADGHTVYSALELAVDNWLHERGLRHDYNAPIPGTRYRTDFLVGGTYIEVWGIEGRERYEARKREKIALYRDLHLPLISLLPTDFPHLTPLLALLPEQRL